MSFEFELVPLGPASCFTPEVLGEMRAWWAPHPTATAADGTLLVFPSEEIRALRLEGLSREPRVNDYLTSMVSFGEDRVELSVTGDETTPWLHAFALECLRRWPSELRYFGEPVSAADILASAE